MADDQPQYTKYRSRPRMPWERGGDDLSQGEPREPRANRAAAG